MNSDLVTRLRELAEENFEMLDNIHEPLQEAADELERRNEEIKLLREALRKIRGWPEIKSTFKLQAIEDICDMALNEKREDA